MTTELRGRATFCRAESARHAAESVAYLALERHQLASATAHAAYAYSVAADSCTLLADEREAHAETRKRLLRLEHRMKRVAGHRAPFVCPPWCLVMFSGRGAPVVHYRDKGNRRAVILFAARHRAAFHAEGRGVP